MSNDNERNFVSQHAEPRGKSNGNRPLLQKESAVCVWTAKFKTNSRGFRLNRLLLAVPFAGNAQFLMRARRHKQFLI